MQVCENFRYQMACMDGMLVWYDFIIEFRLKYYERYLYGNGLDNASRYFNLSVYECHSLFRLRKK